MTKFKQLSTMLLVALLFGCGGDNQDSTSGKYLLKNRIIVRADRIETIFRTHALQDNKFLIKVPPEDVNLRALRETNSIREVTIKKGNPPVLGDYYDENEERRLKAMITDHAPKDFDRVNMKVFYIAPDSEDAGIYLFQSITNPYSLILLSYN